MECKINKNYVGNLFQLEISIFLVSACTQSKLRFLEEILNKKSGIDWPNPRTRFCSCSNRLAHVEAF